MNEKASLSAFNIPFQTENKILTEIFSLKHYFFGNILKYKKKKKS